MACYSGKSEQCDRFAPTALPQAVQHHRSTIKKIHSRKITEQSIQFK